MVGTSGSRLERFGPVYASTRRRPALICGAVEVPDIIAATSPDTVAAVAGAPPLYGICASPIPARPFSRSIVRWCWLPLPPEAYCSGGIGLAHIPNKGGDRKSTRLNSSHDQISYAVFCLK